MVTRLLRPALLGALLAASGCHLLLEGDEVSFEQGGRGGGGQGTGLAGGGGQGSGLGSAGGAGGDGGTGGIGTTVTVGGGGAGEGGMEQGPPCYQEVLDATEVEDGCTVPADTEQLFQFNQTCPHGEWCFSWPGSPGFDEVVLEQEDGSLNLTARPIPGNGWWDTEDRDFAPLLYRRLSGEFSVLIRVTVSNFGDPFQPNQFDYKVAGLVFRNGTGIPTHAGSEQFVKLEYGWIGESALVAPDPTAGFGVLFAQHDEPNRTGPAHLAFVSTDPVNVPSVGLAACRKGLLTHYYADTGAGFVEILEDPDSPQGAMELGTEVSVGLMTGSFSGNGGDTIGTFDYAGYRTGTAMLADCGDEIEDLDQRLAAGRE